MAVNTYDDFEKKLKEYGYAMSDADMQLARMNPDAGMSILNYKRDYANAATDDERALANKGAENIRSTYGNYTGGSDGSKFYVDTPTPMSYYKEDYQNPYQSQYDKALNAVMNQQGWSYDPENDMAYQAAKGGSGDSEYHGTGRGDDRRDSLHGGGERGISGRGLLPDTAERSAWKLHGSQLSAVY